MKPYTETDTKLPGQKRPMQSFNLIYVMMQIAVTLLSSRCSFPLGHWQTLSSHPLQYHPCPNAQPLLCLQQCSDLLRHLRLGVFYLHAILPFGTFFFFLFSISQPCFAPLFSQSDKFTCQRRTMQLQ